MRSWYVQLKVSKFFSFAHYVKLRESAFVICDVFAVVIVFIGKAESNLLFVNVRNGLERIFVITVVDERVRCQKREFAE